MVFGLIEFPAKYNNALSVICQALHLHHQPFALYGYHVIGQDRISAELFSSTLYVIHIYLCLILFVYKVM